MFQIWLSILQWTPSWFTRCFEGALNSKKEEWIENDFGTYVWIRNKWRKNSISKCGLGIPSRLPPSDMIPLTYILTKMGTVNPPPPPRWFWKTKRERLFSTNTTLSLSHWFQTIRSLKISKYEAFRLLKKFSTYIWYRRVLIGLYAPHVRPLITRWTMRRWRASLSRRSVRRSSPTKCRWSPRCGSRGSFLQKSPIANKLLRACLGENNSEFGGFFPSRFPEPVLFRHLADEGKGQGSRHCDRSVPSIESVKIFGWP